MERNRLNIKHLHDWHGSCSIVNRRNRKNTVNKNRKQILEAGLRGEEVLLKGIIIPDEFDALFKMTSILLSTDQELDFMIERNAKGDELFDHLRELVRVKGFIREDQPGKRMIRITDYNVLDLNAEIRIEK
jgi:hypothetical protein